MPKMTVSNAAQSTITGFRDTVIGAQATFHAVMMAMAEPGTIRPLADLPQAPAGLDRALAALALTLLDHETPVWLCKALSSMNGVADYIRFNTGARIVADPGQAAFGLISNFFDIPALKEFSQGTLEYPDRSTTMLVAVRLLDTKSGLTLKGPGIAKSAHLALEPLPANLVAQLAENRARFPLGVDFVFTQDERVAALPRSTRVTMES